MKNLVEELDIQCRINLWRRRKKNQNFYFERRNGLIFAGPELSHVPLDTIVCDNDNAIQQSEITKALGEEKFCSRLFYFIVYSGQETIALALDRAGWVNIRESSIMFRTDPASFSPIFNCKSPLERYDFIDNHDIDLDKWCEVFFDAYDIKESSRIHWKKRLECDFDDTTWKFLALINKNKEYVGIVSLFEDGKISTITNLATRRKYWRKGIGTWLSEHALNILSINNNYITISCNPNSRELYEKLGFSIRSKITYFARSL
ncbi:MAG: GNAT family N-acetyltransferase [Candidatus Scalindua sp.]|nr:GNAT family N-acetyltransferase [Candidatus Scalindua sp.]